MFHLPSLKGLAAAKLPSLTFRHFEEIGRKQEVGLVVPKHGPNGRVQEAHESGEECMDHIYHGNQ